MTRRESIDCWEGRALERLRYAEKRMPRHPSSWRSDHRSDRADQSVSQQKSEGLERRFESRTYKRSWEMPYRLFRPTESGRASLILFCTVAADRAPTMKGSSAWANFRDASLGVA